VLEHVLHILWAREERGGLGQTELMNDGKWDDWIHLVVPRASASDEDGVNSDEEKDQKLFFKTFPNVIIQ
jgi:hypothetical protein